MATKKVTHYIITNRSVYKRGNKEYINDDGTEGAGYDLRFGKIYFDPNKKISSVSGDHYTLFKDPIALDKQQEMDKPLIEKLGSEKLFSELHKDGLKAKEHDHHTLVFIHGFRTDLASALETTRELHNLYVEDKASPIEHIILLTWPAMRKLLEYRDDYQDAVVSGHTFARAFKKLQRFFRQIALASQNGDGKFCGQKIHLMCHSMGAKVLEAMFEEFQNTNTIVNSIFGEIILLAADTDYNCFESPKPMYNLIESGERIHVYYHQHDQALGVSEHTKNAYNRLGRWGAKNTLTLPDSVVQADVSHVAQEGIKNNLIHHWYYLNSKVTVRDIIQVFNGEISIFAE